MRGNRLTLDFYLNDVLVVAPELIGKKLIRELPDGSHSEHIITETEAYRGMEDEACHASKGRTSRTSIMFEEGGVLYMYLIYGMYWMLNIVTSEKENPQAVLIRGINTIYGPGRLSRLLELDKSFNGENLIISDRIWIESSGIRHNYSTHTRIGIDYAGETWKNKPWRFVID